MFRVPGFIDAHGYIRYCGIPMFGINHLGKINLVRIIGRFEKSGVKLQCLTGKGRLSLVRIMGNFQKTEDSRKWDSIVIDCTIVPY